MWGVRQKWKCFKRISNLTFEVLFRVYFWQSAIYVTEVDLLESSDGERYRAIYKVVEKQIVKGLRKALSEWIVERERERHKESEIVVVAPYFTSNASCADKKKDQSQVKNNKRKSNAREKKTQCKTRSCNYTMYYFVFLISRFSLVCIFGAVLWSLLAIHQTFFPHSHIFGTVLATTSLVGSDWTYYLEKRSGDVTQQCNKECADFYTLVLLISKYAAYGSNQAY